MPIRQPKDERRSSAALAFALRRTSGLSIPTKALGRWFVRTSGRVLSLEVRGAVPGLPADGKEETRG